MRRWLRPSTRSMAQSSRWRLAKSRAAMPTATAESSADSSATRLRNFSPRPRVRSISGRPLARLSTCMPRSGTSLIRASAQVTNSFTAASPRAIGMPSGAATASR